MNDVAQVISGVADFLAAVAWPSVVIILVIKFSGNLVNILEAIRLRILMAKDLSLKMGAVHAAASGFVEEAANSAREMVLRTAAPASEVVIQEAAKALKEAESAPTPVEQVRLAQEAVSERLRDLLSTDGKIRGKDTLEDLATTARKAGKISPEAELSIQQLASLARIVRESGASAANERAAKAFSSLAQAVLQSLPYPA